MLTTWDGDIKRQSVGWEIEAEDCAGGGVGVDGHVGWSVGDGVLIQPEVCAAGCDWGVLDVAAGADGDSGEGDGFVGYLAGL